jgi:ATP-dependent Lhr-like helicase
VRAHALARTLLDRHGVVTRGAVAAEGVEGGFSATYRILSVFEESGQARRGYVVEGLGAAQFAMDGAVDRLRAVANARDRGDDLPTPNPTDNDPYGFGALAGSPTPTSGPGDRFPAPTTYDSPDHHGRHDTSRSPGTPGAPGSPDSPGVHDFADAFGPFTDFDDLDVAGSPDGHLTNSDAPASRHNRTPSSHPPSPGDYISPRDFPSPTPRANPASPYASAFANHHTHRPALSTRAVVLAAADPANAYGAALPWPEPPTGAGHKPGRKAGSLVVLVNGELTLYMERGGKTLLAWPSAPDITVTEDPRLQAAAESLAAAARAGALGTVTVERVNGASALTSPIGTLLEGAGFIATPRGLRLRG